MLERCTLRETRALVARVALGLGLVQCAASPTQHPIDAVWRPKPPAAAAPVSALPVSAQPRRPKVIVFVWDGLRPDSVTCATTPNLARLRDQDGVDFRDQHAVYPTFTMMNAAAFATGAYPARHGFYGNTEYQPGATGTNADGKVIDFAQPVFTEDHGVLQALDAFYRAQGKSGLFAVRTLFEAAHAAGLHTAAVGKIGPAFLQDHRPDDALSVVLDENTAIPYAFARALQNAGFALPANTVRYPYPAGQTVTLAADNGKPSAAAAEKVVRLQDNATPDPRSALGSAHNAANEYLMHAYLDYVLPKVDPDLSVVWLRNPDSTEHQFGPGSANYLDALRAQDALLGKLMTRLSELGLQSRTDLFVVSDHGHSTVSGDTTIFPLRALVGEPDGHGRVGALDAAGYAVSGEVRSADILTRAGFKHVYDGGSCIFDPVLSGVRKDGSRVYPTRFDSAGRCAPPTSPPAGTVIGKRPPLSYSMPSYRVQSSLEKDAIVVAANGGSEYFYVLEQSSRAAQALVRALQERTAYGAIFVRSAFGDIPGTLPLSAIGMEGEQRSPPTPDVIVSFTWDEAALASGKASLPGTEYASAQRYRGMHGSFSPRDVHNTLIAVGPHLKTDFKDVLPTSNVDLAPTVAWLLGLQLASADGRVLGEALLGQPELDYAVQMLERSAPPVALSKTCRPDDPSCGHPTGPAEYRMSLKQKILTVNDAGKSQSFSYFDSASVTRRPLAAGSPR